MNPSHKRPALYSLKRTSSPFTAKLLLSVFNQLSNPLKWKKCTFYFYFQWLVEADCFSQPARSMKLVFIKDEWFLTLIPFPSEAAKLVHLGLQTEISHFPHLMPFSSLFALHYLLWHRVLLGFVVSRGQTCFGLPSAAAQIGRQPATLLNRSANRLAISSEETETQACYRDQ